MREMPHMASSVAAYIPCSVGTLEAALQMTVEVPPAFHIFYATGWEEPVLHLRELRADGSPQHEVSPCPPWRIRGTPPGTLS